MIPMSPMFEANFLTTAKNYWFGDNRPKPKTDVPDTRERIMTAARKTVGKDEGGVGGTLGKMLNRRDLLAKAYGD